MRARLLRVGLTCAGAAIVVLTVVVLLGRLWVAEAHLEHSLVVDATIVLVGLAAAAAAVGVYVRCEANRFARHFDHLVDQVRRLGAGDTAIEPDVSGIVEVDAVGNELASSARTLLATLSSERDFAADASHQLRTPLTALLMRLEEIGASDDIDMVRDEAGAAIEQVERLDATVATLLARSRHSGETARPVRVDRVLAILQRTWQPSFEQAHRTISVEGERDVEVVATDAVLVQVLGTLIENSLAHGGGQVTVTVRRSGPSVVIGVEDEGAGIESNLARSVFERHVSTKNSGLGLGLARDLAERYGGRLELVRTRPAHFALFLSASD